MKHQLILQFQTSSIEDYDLIIDLEDKLIELVEPEAEVSGS